MFIHDGERVHNTYFISGRGDEVLGNTWSVLDLTRDRPSRNLGGFSVEGYPQSPPYEWWDWHDSYGQHAPSRWLGDPGPDDPNDPCPRRA